MTKEEDVAIDDEALESEIKSVLNGIPEDKMLFCRFSKKWHGFLDTLLNVFNIIKKEDTKRYCVT